MRLRTKLIFSYVLVVLIAVGVLGTLALPVLQSYQNEKATISQENDRNETATQLDPLVRTLQNDVATNPFRAYLCGGSKKACKDVVPPSREEIEAGFQGLMQGKTFRLVMFDSNPNTPDVLYDSDPDKNKQLSLQSAFMFRNVFPANARTPLPTQDLQLAGRNYFYRGVDLPTLGKYESVLTTAPISHLFGRLNGANTRQVIIAAIFPTQPVPNVLGDLGFILAGAGLAALVVSLIVGFVLSRSISRPLIKATVASQSIARGDYSHTLPLEGGYELAKLAESFNQMSHEVEQSQRIQRELIANVSHELKTPLTAIRGFSQAMLDGALRRPEDFAQPAEIINNETERMIRLVNSLLDLSKLESGQVKMAREELNLEVIFDRSISNFEVRSEQQEVKFSRRYSNLPPVMGDKDRLRQVFNNLLDNALRYTPPGGTITISSQAFGSNIITKVADTGQGISEKDLSRIFERFYQADKSRSKESGGLGLGLAITREIVHAHHGKIEVASQVGKGTTFTITLPVSETAKEHAPTVEIQLPVQIKSKI